MAPSHRPAWLLSAGGLRRWSVVLERDVEPDAELGDLAVFDGDVLPDDLCDTKIAKGFGCRLDGALRGRLPRRAAGPHELSDSVDAVGHGYLLFISAESAAIVARFQERARPSRRRSGSRSATLPARAPASAPRR